MTHTSGSPHGEAIILATGMHRSGTSLLANLLHLLGVDMTADPVLGFEENARGFWERSEVVALHDAMLAHLRREFSCALHALPLAPGWWRRPDLDPLRRRTLERVRELRVATARPLGVKDPRLCLLLPLWRDMAGELGQDVKVLASIRHPLAVAASLKRRDGMDAGRALYMWLSYYLNLLNATTGRQRLFVEYERWFQEPLEQARGVLGFLGMDWPGTQKELGQVVAATADAGLRRNASGPEEGIWPPVLSLYRALRQTARTGESDALDAVAADLWERYMAAAPAVASLEEERASREHRQAALEEALKQAERDRSAEAARVDERDEALARLQESHAARLRDMDEALTRLQEASAARLREKDDALARLEEAGDALRDEAAENAARISELEAALHQEQQCAEARTAAANRATAALAAERNAAARRALRLDEALREAETLRRQADEALAERDALRERLARALPAEALSLALHFEGGVLAVGRPAEAGPDANPGYVDEVAYEDGAYVVRGWAWDAASAAPASAILVFDDQGFAGWGLPTAVRPDVRAALGLAEDAPTGFHIPLGRPLAGRVVCRALAADGGLYELPHAD